jgi:DNA-binding NtrC family response regulator
MMEMARERSIIIIDDDESQLEFCAAAVQLSGFRAAVAASSGRALALLRSWPFAAVLTDHLPSPTGRSWIADLKAARPGSAVLLMTARPTLPDALTAVAAGALDYLPKPFSAARLRDALERPKRRTRTGPRVSAAGPAASAEKSLSISARAPSGCGGGSSASTVMRTRPEPAGEDERANFRTKSSKRTRSQSTWRVAPSSE